MIRNAYLQVKYAIFNVKYGIINLIKYFKIVWKDRDWDHYYLLELLEFKIKHMAYQHENYSHSEESIKISRDLRNLEHILCVLKNDDINPYYIRVQNKYGELNFTENTIAPLKVIDKTYTEEEYRNDFLLALQKDERIKKRYIRQMSYYMKKYEQWWD